MSDNRLLKEFVGLLFEVDTVGASGQTGAAGGVALGDASKLESAIRSMFSGLGATDTIVIKKKTTSKGSNPALVELLVGNKKFTVTITPS